MPKTEKELLERDAARDIGAELLESIREMKAGKATAVHYIHFGSGSAGLGGVGGLCEQPINNP
jgi:hypothetical protein